MLLYISMFHFPICCHKVSTDEGQALASQWECPFYETSAALRRYVDEAFHDLIREIRRRENEAVAAAEKQIKAQRSTGKKIKDFFRHVNIFKKSS